MSPTIGYTYGYYISIPVLRSPLYTQQPEARSQSPSHRNRRIG